MFWVVKREFPEAPRLKHASYFLPAEGNMFLAILDTIGFNPIRVGIKLLHRCLLTHYYSINNNKFSPNCYLDLTNMPICM